MGNRSRQQKSKQKEPSKLSFEDINKALESRGLPLQEPEALKVKRSRRKVKQVVMEELPEGYIMSSDSDQSDASDASDASEEIPSDIDVSDSDLESLNQDKVKNMFEESDDDDEETRFEKDARAEDLQDLLDREEGDKELESNIQERPELVIPGPDKVEKEEISDLQNRIGEIIRVLNNFKELGARSRSDYVDQLVRDLGEYYGYNEYLAQILFELFPLAEVNDSNYLINSIIISILLPHH